MLSSITQSDYFFIDIGSFPKKNLSKIGLDVFLDSVEEGEGCYIRIPRAALEESMNLYEIDFSVSMLVPVKIVKRRDDRRRKVVKEKDLLPHSMDTLIELTKNLIRIHKESMLEHEASIDMFSSKKQKIIKQINGKWHKMFEKYGSKVTKVSDKLYCLHYRDRKFLFCNDNGRWRAQGESSAWLFIKFFEKEMKLDEKAIWKSIESFCQIPEMRMDDVVEQEGSYHIVNKGNYKQITNWIGKITSQTIDSEGVSSWCFEIDGQEIIMEAKCIHEPKAFQQAIAERGMYFFFGSENELKKMINHMYIKDKNRIILNDLRKEGGNIIEGLFDSSDDNDIFDS